MQNKTEQIREYIQTMIIRGELKKGQRLPGCRSLAEQLSVNKITVNKAYRELEEAHIVYSIPRGGYYLIGMEENDIAEDKVIDFANVLPDPSLIPYQSFTHAMNRSIEEYKKKLFLYDTPLGLGSLRATLQERFEQNGIYTPLSQIMITHGAQQAIYLILKALFHEKAQGSLLVESPTYSCILTMAKELNISYTSIDRTEEGISFKELEMIFQTKQIRLFYLIPRYHNPTGYSLSEKDKVRLAELCHQYQVLILEDDYLGDLCNDRRNLPLHYYDTHQLTFYVCSFSKSFMPGIRLGAAVLPEAYTEAAVRVKYMLDLCTSGLPQSALDFYIRSGMYDQHLIKTRACYQSKLQKARGILSGSSISGFSYHVPKQGIFLWLELPKQVSIQELKDRLFEAGIEIAPSYPYYPGEVRTCLRLCISGVQKEDLDALYTVLEYIKVLAENHR
jgi:DNA-binding transcriptional MocR family regulator